MDGSWRIAGASRMAQEVKALPPSLTIPVWFPGPIWLTEQTHRHVVNASLIGIVCFLSWHASQRSVSVPDLSYSGSLSVWLRGHHVQALLCHHTNTQYSCWPSMHRWKCITKMGAHVCWWHLKIDLFIFVCAPVCVSVHHAHACS